MDWRLPVICSSDGNDAGAPSRAGAVVLPQGALIVRSCCSRACAGVRARFFAARTAPFSRLSTRQRLVKSSPKPQSQPSNLHLRKLTSRIAELTRRRQLHQIFEEVKVAKKRHGKLNTIVMNAVMEACVHCGNVDAALGLFAEMAKPDGCGWITSPLQPGYCFRRPKLSSHLIYGLLNALLESGDMRRANGLLARYRVVLREEGHSIFLYNLLIKGYTNTDFPLGALAVRDEILRQGLKPDKLTYNTLILSCVKSRRMDVAMGLLAEMKEEGEKANNTDLFPDTVTYTTLLQGFGSMKDLLSVQEIVMEMKSSPKVVFDRVAYTAIVDAFLGCGSTKDALCIFGEILKLAGENAGLRPKPHLFLSMMREFAAEGDFHMVQGLRGRMWSDSVGFISPVAQGEADELLMEQQILSSILRRGKWSSWTSRGGMVALRLEALSGFTVLCSTPASSPRFVSLDDPIEKYMTPFEEANPLRTGLILKKVAMRFYRDAAVPIVDDWGTCVGIVHREDCREIDAPLSAAMRAPPPCVTTSTSTGRVIELLIQKRYEMVVVVRSGSIFDAGHSAGSRPVGVFTRRQLLRSTAEEQVPPHPVCRIFGYS
ncbi:unnamed protein product [Spirodela intermedia]|uniref:CBS domain-containing protein n=1 Tax=Spirodela intermedia TaxID=51605 RepID=A0A7I8IXK2_SPIIN|nr:unnamed protein product [Spirodela intermedia]CAA6662305.1 unnamed protein product [Spirodela intermedia]